MYSEKAYLTQLLEGLVVTDSGVYLIRRANAALVLGADAEGKSSEGLSFDKTLDQVLVNHEYDPTDLRFSVPDKEGNTYVPIDVAVGSWMRWAASGSDKAILLLNNLAIAGLIKLFNQSAVSPTP